MRIFTAVLLLTVTMATGAELVIEGKADTTYDGGTYTRLYIANSTGITVKNCTFRTPAGETTTPARIDVGCSNITIQSCELDGNGEACMLLGMKGDTITVKNCFMHSAADDGVQCHQGTYLKFHDNVIGDLLGIGTDGRLPGPCSNGHSDGFELSNVQHAEFKRNFVYGVYSTSAFFLGNWSVDAKNNQDFLLCNNIFYPHYAGYVIYLHYIDGVKLYNNTFWKGGKGGLVLGPQVKNLIARNNIFHTVNLNLMNTTLDPVNHDFDYSGHGLGSQGFPLQPHDRLMPNVLFQRAPNVISSTFMDDPQPEDFSLQAGSPAIGIGTSGGDIPTTDFFGHPRTEPYDLGAIESAFSGVDDADGMLNALTEITVSPNPAARTVAIGMNRSGVRPHGISICTLDGTDVWHAAVEPNARTVRWNTVDMSGNSVKEGLYTVRLAFPDRIVSHILVITR